MWIFERTSIELTVRRRASEVWLIAVPRVGAGGFVTPIVPVARTPSKYQSVSPLSTTFSFFFSPGTAAAEPASMRVIAEARASMMKIKTRYFGAAGGVQGAIPGAFEGRRRGKGEAQALASGFNNNCGIKISSSRRCFKDRGSVINRLY